MDYSFLALILFVCSTLIYFLFMKPKLTIDTQYVDYYRSANKSLMYYIALIIASQLLLNVFYLMSKCGGSPGQNIAAAFGYTLVPYLFIFGILVAVIVLYPSLKTAFSNVIGYMFISSSANRVLTELLVNTNIQDAAAQLEPEEQRKMEHTAELIMKICSNMSLLINQITPENFNHMWNNVLTPLFKRSLTPDTLKEKKEELLRLVALKDNIGEGCWYVYAGVLVTSMVAYNLATRGCIKSVEQIKEDHDKYIKEQEANTKQAELEAQTPTY